MITGAAEGCKLCQGFLKHVSADKIEEMVRHDSPLESGYGETTMNLPYKQDLDLLIFLNSNGQNLPLILEVQFTGGDGATPKQGRICPSTFLMAKKV